MALPIVIVVVLGAAIACYDGGMPFYRHIRVGRGGKSFGCLKIRTMRKDADQILHQLLKTDANARREWEAHQKLRDDPRVTRVGRFLRKVSIDELPQLLNVLRGKMTLIGPRPVTEAELDRYGEAKRAYLSVVPGITGAWQVHPKRNEMTYDERVALDRDYAQSYCFRSDLKILLATLSWVMSPNGM
jgi:lipopolysaccharide/colanic/teichoic acid biosynthesis glycosyltransferase